MSLRALWTAPLVAGLVLTGCSAPADEARQAAPAQVAPAQVAPAPVAPAQVEPAAPPPVTAPTSEPPRVTLLAAGAAPHAPLRLTVGAGASESLNMTMKMAIRIDLGQGPLPQAKLPPMRVVMRSRVLEVTPGDDLRCETTLERIEVLDDPDVTPDVVASLRSALGSLQDLTGSTTVTRRGLVRSFALALPADLAPELRQTLDSMRSSLDQLVVPFPEEPVGVGARWSVERALEQQGMHLTQTTTYTLDTREGDEIGLGLSVVQTAEPQPMHPPGVPPGVKTRLESLRASGRGEVRIDLGRISPRRARVAVESEIRTSAQSPEGTARTALDLTLETELVGE